MRLPNGDQAVIGPRRLQEYLLSTEHPVGRFKAAWSKRQGFTLEDWQTLDAELRRLAAEGEAEAGTREDVPRFVTAFPEEGA